VRGDEGRGGEEEEEEVMRGGSREREQDGRIEGKGAGGRG
jgi:hypothetical protein